MKLHMLTTKIKWKTAFFLLGLLLVTVLSFKLLPLRKLGYDYLPKSESTDEQDYALAGSSFRKTGVPMGWSLFQDQYMENGTLASDMNGFTLVDEHGEAASNGKALLHTVQLDLGKGDEHMILIQPFVDHPLLGSFLIGTEQVQRVDQIDLVVARKNLITTGFISGILIYIFVWLLSGDVLTGVIGWGVYTLSPSIFLSSRYAFLENILIPFSVGAFCLLLLVEKIKIPKWKVMTLVFAGVVTGLAINVKEVGVHVLITGVIYLLQILKDKRKIWFYLLPALVVGSLSYLFYFLMLGNGYLEILFGQISRSYHGPLGLWKMIVSLKFQNFPIDGYWLYGVISLIIFSFREKIKYPLLTISWWVLILVIGLIGNEYYPWYGLVLVPLVTAGAALMIGELIRKPKWNNLILFLILPLSTTFFWGKYFLNPEINFSNHFRIITLLILASGCVFAKEKKLQGSKKLIWTVVILGLLLRMGTLSIRGIQTYFEKYENIPDKWVVQQKI